MMGAQEEVQLREQDFGNFQVPTTSVLYSDRRAVQAIGRIDRGADQNEGYNGTLFLCRRRFKIRAAWALGLHAPLAWVISAARDLGLELQSCMAL